MPARLMVRGPLFSLSNRSAIAPSPGGSFTGLTVSLKVWLALALLAAVTVRVMRLIPDWFGAGVRVMVRLVPLPPKAMRLVGTRAGSEEVTDNARASAVVSTSRMRNGMAAVAVSSSMTTSSMVEMVGGWLAVITGFTVRRKEVRLVAAPSVTWTVMVAVPL